MQDFKYRDEANGTVVTYACAGSYSVLSISVDGNHAGPDGSISVDGQEIHRGPQNYSGHSDSTAFAFDVKADYGDLLKNELNAMIAAIAGGKELTYVMSDDTAGTADLTGSSEITNCTMR